MLVVDRVEAAPGQEREVLAVGRERGVGVGEPGLGDRHQRVVGEPGEHDPGEVGLDRVAVGEPRAVGRPAQVGDLPVGAPRELTQRAVARVQYEQPAVVRGQRHRGAIGCGRELEHAAHRTRGEPAQRRGLGTAVERGDAHGVLALGVVHPHRAILAQRPGQPGPDAGLAEQGAGRTVAVGEPVDRAADQRDARAPGAVGRGPGERAGRAEAVRVAGAARTTEPHVQPPGRGVERLEEPQLARRLVDDPLPVGAGVPHVERGGAGTTVVGVAPQAGAVDGERVEVAPALMVGQERDAQAPAAPHEHRGGELPVQLRGQPDELARPVGVPPQLARRAAPVALPPRHLPRDQRAGDDGGAAVAGQRDVGHRAEVQPPRRAALGGDGVGPGAPWRGLPGGAQREHLPLRRPAHHLRPGVAPVGQPPRAPAVGVGHVGLGCPVAPGRPRHLRAVRGQPRVRDRLAVGREPVGAAAGQRSRPHVVLGHEDEGVAVQVREAEVAGGHDATVATRTDSRPPSACVLVRCPAG